MASALQGNDNLNTNEYSKCPDSVGSNMELIL
jgi:hypothetical protein